MIYYKYEHAKGTSPDRKKPSLRPPLPAGPPPGMPHSPPPGARTIYRGS